MGFETNGTLARRGLMTPVFMGAAFVALLWVMTRAPGISTLGIVAGAAMLAFAAAMLVLRLPFKKGRTRSRVAVDSRGLVVDGDVVVLRGAVRAAYPETTAEGAQTLRVDAGPLRTRVVYVDQFEDAERLAAELSEHASGAVMRVVALPPWARHIRPLSVLLTTSPWVLFNAVRWLPPWAMALLVALYGVVALPVFLPQRVEIGRDGVLLRWLGRRRFLPFSAIRSVEETSLGFSLSLDEGRSVDVRLTQQAKAAHARAKAIVKRIEQLRASVSALTAAEEQALLARGDRDLDTWHRDVRAMGEPGAHGYRAVAVPRERLWSVLESPAADLSAREGAAIALHASIDDADRERLASVLRATASPRLRVALDVVSTAPDAETLRVAYDAVEAEEEAPEAPRARARR